MRKKSESDILLKHNPSCSCAVLRSPEVKVGITSSSTTDFSLNTPSNNETETVFHKIHHEQLVDFSVRVCCCWEEERGKRLVD